MQIEENPVMADDIVDALLEGINFTLPLLPKTITAPPGPKVPVKTRKPSKVPPLKLDFPPLKYRESPLPDIFQVFAKGGKKMLIQELNLLGIEQLKEIVSQHRFDPTGLARKWKDRKRLINLILARLESRSKKGDVFRKY